MIEIALTAAFLSGAGIAGTLVAMFFTPKLSDAQRRVDHWRDVADDAEYYRTQAESALAADRTKRSQAVSKGNRTRYAKLRGEA